MSNWILPCWYLFHLSIHLLPILSLQPPPPIQCTTTTTTTNCTVSNAYGAWGDRRQCTATSILYPTTESELLTAVAQATRLRHHIKVVTAFSHTIPKLACPSSSTTTTTTLISTERLTSDIEVDPTEHVVTVDAGVGMRELIDKVEEEGMSLVAAPYWEGVSVGGALSTGSVGSSWWGKGGALHAHVVGMRLVVTASPEEGFAKVVSLVDGDPLLDAAKVSLGVLGVISKVRRISINHFPFWSNRLT